MKNPEMRRKVKMLKKLKRKNWRRRKKKNLKLIAGMLPSEPVFAKSVELYPETLQLAENYPKLLALLPI